MKPLNEEEKRIMLDKGTEPPFSGKYYRHKAAGRYLCRQCGAPLYLSEDKFSSGCGWPSFDAEIPGAVKRVPDSDGVRTEIVCAHCGGHLGHVFEGEHLTAKNVRHCVNSLSLVFQPAGRQAESQEGETAIFAGGCFWGVEHLMKNFPGIISIEPGYTGGYVDNPTYEQVCSHLTGHAEAVRIVFDPSQVSYETLLKGFMEIHDPTQEGGQGPDLGPQYRSEIFYLNEQQHKTAQRIIALLKQKGYPVVTRLTSASAFWPAEDYHHRYYERTGSVPYCHRRVKRFDD